MKLSTWTTETRSMKSAHLRPDVAIEAAAALIISGKPNTISLESEADTVVLIKSSLSLGHVPTGSCSQQALTYSPVEGRNSPVFEQLIIAYARQEKLL